MKIIGEEENEKKEDDEIIRKIESAYLKYRREKEEELKKKEEEKLKEDEIKKKEDELKKKEDDLKKKEEEKILKKIEKENKKEMIERREFLKEKGEYIQDVIDDDENNFIVLEKLPQVELKKIFDEEKNKEIRLMNNSEALQEILKEIKIIKKLLEKII